MHHMQKIWIGTGTVAAAILGLSLLTTPAYADETIETIPPVATATTQSEQLTTGWVHQADGSIIYYDTDGNKLTGTKWKLTENITCFRKVVYCLPAGRLSMGIDTTMTKKLGNHSSAGWTGTAAGTTFKKTLVNKPVGWFWRITTFPAGISSMQTVFCRPVSFVRKKAARSTTPKQMVQC